ncbi:arabinosaccharide transport system substrate-binding protein [Clostridium saccharoperbutylacetonicum]|uniref:Putative arabinose-binding protein AraN n=1 Tax=Clostridium saccharoperbutylacetonicum N1-4(HMT) TaxID=931276 RepID=M1LXH9_9CLOT|nr:extracellular solute-binding protein [Clostridium saccharoperbutylacetonicum]AGF57975.1 putative arabinose-binding protein AraN [Clostridium saccharoperbutylacetonicum N1-4(HMT)]NRT61252.1 arabinosaccharide transport system substrate-binding protein [Clostridium saccharoperbutylacetonicum]NSB24569.1 arabinosaccharide transport system substrate-binding protein [Clostridium saccharoperbutylacetonicum]NSB43944.1 arabinosaccharide transport system substrate-binding protein [Clostridium saccharop
MKSVKILKKLATAVVTTTLAASMLIGCGGNTASTSSSNDGKKDAASNSGDQLEMWTFVDMHATFFQKMLDKWNQKNPDKKLNIKFTVLPYDDMHNKLQSALLSGQGAPDVADVEVGKFPNFLKGDPQFEPLDDVFVPYKDKVVKSRVELYSKDNHVYGFDYHVGATVAYYNTELLEKAGIDYKTIVTWDDFKKAGAKYYAATGKNFGTADTSAAWQTSLMLAEQKSDYTDANGKPQLNSPQMVKALTTLRDMQDAHAIATIPGGQPDTTDAEGAINNGDYAVVIKAMWYMSRFLQYMPDQAGKWAIAPAPVFEKGQPRSVGLGGTGTVVTKTAKNKQNLKEFIAYAKLSEDGERAIWDDLGFDPINTDLWNDKTLTQNKDNKFIKYFKTNPFDTLNEIKNEISLIKSNQAMPSINNVLCTVTLNSIFEDKKDIKQALDEAQQQVENELK